MENTIEELDEIMRNLNLGEAMDHSNFSQNFRINIAADFTTRNGGISNNVHQVCVFFERVQYFIDQLESLRRASRMTSGAPSRKTEKIRSSALRAKICADSLRKRLM
jgi:hypothetical protein